jgi:hypothetical protein
LDPVTGYIALDNELDALCDEHWKKEVLGL